MLILKIFFCVYTLHLSCDDFWSYMNTDPDTFKNWMLDLHLFRPLLYNSCQMVPWQYLRWCCVTVPIVTIRIYASKILWLAEDAKFPPNQKYYVHFKCSVNNQIYFHFYLGIQHWIYGIYVLYSKIMCDYRWNYVISVSRRTKVYNLYLIYSTYFSVSTLV